MAGKKYQTLVNGRDTLVASTQVSAGVGNASDIVALDATGRLDVSVLPVGVGPDVSIVLASEALSAGDYVNIYNNAGTPNARKADSTNDRPAHGFVKSAVLSAANATVYFEGPNDAKSGLTIGARYYLGAAGAVIATAPVLPTNVISQYVGLAVAATTINTDIDDEIVL
jgi:hypothetical protein